jgi:hypothetical protein
VSAKLAEIKACWRAKGYRKGLVDATPAEVLAYLHFVGHRWPPEAVELMLAGLRAPLRDMLAALPDLPGPSKVTDTEARWMAVCYCHALGLRGHAARVKAAEWLGGEAGGVGPDMLKKDYYAWERTQPKKLRRRPRRGRPKKENQTRQTT